MLDSIDHIIIAVEDLPSSIEDYSKILGIPPTWQGEHTGQGTENALFPLENLYLELIAAKEEGTGAVTIKSFLELKGEGLFGIALGTTDIEAVQKDLVSKEVKVGELFHGEGTEVSQNTIRTWKNLLLPFSVTRGVFTLVIEHVSGLLPEHKETYKSPVRRLDHVVINTNDPDGIISLYKDKYGIRLALDQTVEQWGGRMLFFRLNHTTIEVVGKENNQEIEDSLSGLAWVVDDLQATYNRLVTEGVEVTEVKKGRKTGTLVATIKSHTSNVPTLLIQHL